MQKVFSSFKFYWNLKLEKVIFIIAYNHWKKKKNFHQYLGLVLDSGVALVYYKNIIWQGVAMQMLKCFVWIVAHKVLQEWCNFVGEPVSWHHPGWQNTNRTF